MQKLVIFRYDSSLSVLPDKRSCQLTQTPF